MLLSGGSITLLHIELTKIEMSPEGVYFFDPAVIVFGFFHVTDGNADSMEALLKDYLTRSYEKNQSWYDSYIPKEIPKLRDAEVKVFGNYVIYTICSKEDRAAVFSAVADLLKQN